MNLFDRRHIFKWEKKQGIQFLIILIREFQLIDVEKLDQS